MDASVSKETKREQMFSHYWKNDLDPVFTDVASYYDNANQVASLGLWNWFLRHHMDLVETQPNMRSLDICAGTNAVGIALLKKEPTLEAYALDRNVAMQTVGRQRARDRDMHIRASIGDVHKLPYPDNHFDLVVAMGVIEKSGARKPFGLAPSALLPLFSSDKSIGLRVDLALDALAARAP